MVYIEVKNADYSPEGDYMNFFYNAGYNLCYIISDYKKLDHRWGAL